MPIPYKIALVGKNTDECREMLDMMKRNDPSIERISENHLVFVFVTSENPEVARWQIFDRVYLAWDGDGIHWIHEDCISRLKANQ